MVEQADHKTTRGRRRIIKRPRLTRLLDETDARLIMLVGPPGYGKTTLARQWLGEKGRRSAWYQGSPSSADVAALAYGLARKTANIVANSDLRVRERVRLSGQPEEEAELLADLLAEDLAGWPLDAWLVVDDYHFAMSSPASERFVEELWSNSAVRLLVTSRRRPTWASARRILYGEVIEFDTESLAMSDEEARAVLERGSGDVGTLLNAAKGWPAVIGLAALTPQNADAHRLPSALYDYFAEELFQAAGRGVQVDLCQLAVLPTLTTEIADDLLGVERAAIALDAGVRMGFLSAEDLSTFELHPLLQRFLLDKLSEDSTGNTQVVKRVVRLLIARHRWDDAFETVERFRTQDLLVELVEAALDEMVPEGRLATLDRWLAYAKLRAVDSPVLDLARAESAFKKGSHAEVAALATGALRQLPSCHKLASGALTRAGQSAFLDGHEELAFELHRRARQVARTREEVREALMGQLIAATDLERRDVNEILAELEGLGDSSPVGVIRLASAKLVVATRFGGLTEAVREGEVALRRPGIAADPLNYLSLLQSLTTALVLLGRYERARSFSAEALSQAHKYRLRFALPHISLSAACVANGLRHFSEADANLERAETLSGSHDHWMWANCTAARARFSLCRGESPVEEFRPEVAESTLARAMRGEYCSSFALALACKGDCDAAVGLADQATRLTRAADARASQRLIDAIVGIRRHASDAHLFAQEVASETFSTGFIDQFVCAYRGFPALLKAAAEAQALRGRLREVLTNANDRTLGNRAGLEIILPDRPLDELSRRELEVHELLADGRTNKEIAHELFISEATVKVHVRHIFDKLGVRTRTQAALRHSRNL